MATAKKSARAKKPSTRKKSASASAASRKSAAKKPAVKAAAVSKDRPAMVTTEKLRKFNLFAALLNAIFAVLSVVLLSNKSVDLSVGYSTKDELASGSTTVLGPVFDVFATVELRYYLAALFGLAAVFSLLLATRLRARYEQGLANRVSALRWVFMGVLAGMSLKFASVLAGIEDIITLKFVFALILVTVLLGWLSEVQNRNGAKNYAAFYLSLFTGFLAWIPLLTALVATSVYGMEHFSWDVYVLPAVLLLGFTNFSINQYRYIRDGAPGDKYLDVEGRYVSTDLLLRIATFVIVVIALGK